MTAQPQRRRTHRTIRFCILSTVAPLMLIAGVAGMGNRAATAGLGGHNLVASSPLQCIAENIQCAKDAASGTNPCDPIPC